MTMPTGPLTGVRVVEVEPGFGVYAGRLLATLGADVTTLVPSDDDVPFLLRQDASDAGDRLDYTAEFHRSGRRYVTVGPLGSAGARDAIEAQLTDAQVLITGLRAAELERIGLDPEGVARRFPALVHLSVTPFGLTGPRANDPASDLTVLAAGGLLSLAGEADRPPVRPYGRQTVVAASLYGAFAALVALRGAEAGGLGELVDVSAHGAVANSLENAAQFWDLEGVRRRRAGGDDPEAGNGLYACADGFVYLMTAMHGGLLAWDRFLLWMGQERPDVAEEFGKPQWLDMRWRRTDEAKRQFRTLFESFSLSRDKRALFVEGQRMGVGIGPLADTVDLLNSPQLTERDFIRDVVLPDGRSACLPGAPFRMSETPAQVYLYRPAELVAGSAS